MLVIACAIIVVDYQTTWLSPVRTWFLAVSQPVYRFSQLPQRAFAWADDVFTSNTQLRLENARLHTENLVLQAKVQKLSALTIENIRLRELLNSSQTSEENATIAEIIAASPDPYRHFVIVNKGSSRGIFKGQAVVDAEGLFGQVIEVSDHSSKVILISDLRHGVPVQVDRNGVRLIVEGTGDYTRVQVPFVTTTTDLVVGDILSTSGLDGVFPPNYPVARVTAIEHHPGAAFADVYAEPFALLSRTKYVLLLFSKRASNEN